MDKQKILVAFIQDRSGSMSSVWEETLSGFKTFVADLKKGNQEDNKDYLFTLTTFDTQIETPLEAISIDQVSVDELAKHGPRGGTALYDAVGRTIQSIEADDKEAAKIICVIVTDGQENASREWSKDALHKAIEAKLKLGNWTFTYLGTQPETWDEARSLGLGVGAVANYQGMHAHAAYANTSHAVRGMSVSATMSSASLMSDFVSLEDERSAGMKIDRTNSLAPDHVTTTTVTPPPVATKRWTMPNQPMIHNVKRDDKRRWK